MTDEPRDELDRALASRLDALAGGDDDAVAMLETMRPGLQRARTRHRMVRASAAALILAVVVSLVAVVSSASTRHGNIAVQPASSTSVQPIVPKPKPPKLRTVTTTTKPGGPAATTPGGTQSPTAPAPGTPPAGNPGPGGGSDGPSDGGSPITSGSPQTHTYVAPGGRVTVQCASGRLSLVSYAANDTWTSELHTNTPQEIELRFSRSASGISGGGHDSSVSGDGQSRIDVRVEGSCAQLQVETE